MAEEQGNGLGTIDLGGLVSAVEGKMSDLMKWHNQQVAELDAAKAEHARVSKKERAELKARREKLDQDRAALAKKAEGLEREREKLLGLAQKLEAEQGALGREWTAVHQARELNEKLAAELGKERERVAERAGLWLTETVASLRLTEDVDGQDDNDDAKRQAA